MCPYYLDGDLNSEEFGDYPLPACLSLRRAVATVQFSRVVREGSWPARHHGGRRAGARSLKTQQHARLELGDLPRAPSKSAAHCLVQRDSWPGQVRSTC